LTIANERLKELDRLKSKFVSDVSHELRTPITNLGLYVQLMQRGNAEKQAHYLNVLHLQSERLRNLVEDILSLSRLERLKGEIKLTAVNINNIITQVVQSQPIQAKVGNLTLSVTLQPELPLAQSDNDHALQVIYNLLDNALNYTREGGVEISTAIDTESDMICITIADTGAGIVQQDMPYIFDRFYRGQDVGSSSIPGTGLGLSIVQEIVQLHNGRLSIESEAGKGTTAHVWLQQAQSLGHSLMPVLNT
jgi:signal transduction histidine kinase